MKRRRRILLQWLIAAAVGVVVTVGICWLAMPLPSGNAWYGPRTTQEIGLAASEDGHRTFTISRGENAWHTVVSYWWMQVSGMSLMMPSDDFEARKVDLDTLPRRFRPESLDDIVMLSRYHETGWPMGAMTCSVHWEKQISNADIIYRVRGGIQLPRDAEFNPRALPLTPVWPGFVVNVLFYGGLWLALGWGVRAIRSNRRAKRGLCIGCGYPRTGLRAGSKCPECGADPAGVISEVAAAADCAAHDGERSDRAHPST